MRPEADVVELSVGSTGERGDGDDPLRCLEAGQTLLDVRDQHRFIDRGAAGGLDERGHSLPEPVVGHTDDGRVTDRRMALQRLLDLFGKDFSPPVLMQWLPRPSSRTVPSASTVARSPGIE